jgi:hypothetical protein
LLLRIPKGTGALLERDGVSVAMGAENWQGSVVLEAMKRVYNKEKKKKKREKENERVLRSRKI